MYYYSLATLVGMGSDSIQQQLDAGLGRFVNFPLMLGMDSEIFLLISYRSNQHMDILSIKSLIQRIWSRLHGMSITCTFLELTRQDSIYESLTYMMAKMVSDRVDVELLWKTGMVFLRFSDALAVSHIPSLRTLGSQWLDDKVDSGQGYSEDYVLVLPFIGIVLSMLTIYSSNIAPDQKVANIRQVIDENGALVSSLVTPVVDACGRLGIESLGLIQMMHH